MVNPRCKMETLETIDGRGILSVPPEGQSNRVKRNFFSQSSKTFKSFMTIPYRSHTVSSRCLDPFDIVSYYI